VIEDMQQYKSILCTILLIIPFSALGDACPFEQSVYKDVDNRGFLLQFTPPQVNTARTVHSATITHPQRGTIFELDFMYGMGYGQPFLEPRNAAKDDTKAFNIHFFDQSLKTTDLDKLAPPYLFIERLGPADWYGVQADTTARKIPIGTPLWRFDHCRQDQKETE
jgi:hypothetical protein